MMGREMQDVGAYREITVKPIGGMLGAEISGVDLRDCTDDAFAEIRRAFADHSVICFRDQSLTALEWEAFGARFGQLSITSYVPPLKGTTYIQHFLREADFKWGDRNFGDNWHQDQTIREGPNIVAGLYSVDSPRMGGDTMFTSLYAAFETLSPRLQAICEDLVLIHSATGLYGRDGYGGPGVKKAIDRAAFTLTDDQLRDHLAKETRHPLIIRHPVTGRRILYISGPYAVRFDGMTEEESTPLISYLYNHAQRPEFTIRWRWEPGQVVVWDNWACMHFGVQDYFGQRREMYRFEVEGPKPEAARAGQSSQAEADLLDRG
jgi:taurine dioxygenase